MEICLTGSVNLNAEEALSLGLVSKVIPADQLVDETVKTAEKIANMSQPMTQMIKECINQCECIMCVLTISNPFQ
jgi:enoyl-CoA hydratase/carnithine racemase